MNQLDFEPRTSSRPQRRRGDYTIGRHNLPICARTGKVRYRERAQAKDGLLSAKWKRRLDGLAGIESRRNESRSYRCPDCNGWHNTSIAVWVDRSASDSSAAVSA